jgi:hypothetical protein
MYKSVGYTHVDELTSLLPRDAKAHDRVVADPARHKPITNLDSSCIQLVSVVTIQLSLSSTASHKRDPTPQTTSHGHGPHTH